VAHNIVIDLSPQSIDKALEWVRQERTRIQNAINSLIQMLLDKGVEVAKAHVVNIDTGATLNSIHSSIGMYKDDVVGVIIAGEHAVWLEFGTGVRHNGAGGSYPIELPQGTTNGTYPISPPKPSTENGWYYPTDDERYILFEIDGQGYGFTYGIASNQFMYKAMQSIIAVAPQWAKDHFEALL